MRLVSSGVSVLFFLSTVLPVFAHPGAHKKIKRFSDKISKAPTANAYLARGIAYYEHNSCDLAKPDLEKSLQIEPNNKAPYYYLSLCSKNQNPKQALEFINKFIKSEKVNPIGLLHRVDIYKNLKKNNLAVIDIDRIISLTKNPSPTLFLKRFALQKDTSLAQGVLGLKQAIRKIGNVVTLVEPLIEAQLELGETKQALESFELLPKSLKSLPRHLKREGEIYLLLGEQKRAKEKFKFAASQLESLSLRRRNLTANKILKKKIENRLTGLELNLRN